MHLKMLDLSGTEHVIVSKNYCFVKQSAESRVKILETPEKVTVQPWKLHTTLQCTTLQCTLRGALFLRSATTARAITILQSKSYFIIWRYYCTPYEYNTKLLPYLHISILNNACALMIFWYLKNEKKISWKIFFT